MKSWKFLWLYLLAVALAAYGHGYWTASAAPAQAADVDLSAAEKPWEVVAVTTSAVKTVVLPDNDVLIAHLGVQDDAGTASAATDYIVVMRAKDENGAAVSMAATYAAGIKLPIRANGAATFRANGIPTGANGAREIQLKAVGNNARVLIVRGIKAK